MAWTYDTALTEEKDQVRFYLGDRDESDPLFSDEEIAGMLTLAGGVRRTVIQCAEILAVSFLRQAQSITDDIGQSKTYGDRAEGFRLLAAQFRREAARFATPRAGGISRTDKLAQESDTDRTLPDFTRRTFENPGLLPMTNQELQ